MITLYAHLTTYSPFQHSLTVYDLPYNSSTRNHVFWPFFRTPERHHANVCTDFSLCQSLPCSQTSLFSGTFENIVRCQAPPTFEIMFVKDIGRKRGLCANYLVGIVYFLKVWSWYDKSNFAIGYILCKSFNTHAWLMAVAHSSRMRSTRRVQLLVRPEVD